MGNRFMRIWRPHTAGFIIGGALVVVLASSIAFIALNFQPKTELRIGNGVFNVRVARDDESRVHGLSGVEKLNPNEGLLMAFNRNDKWGIWMKDMKFAIDIIWLDENKEVVHIVKNASPELSTSKVFQPMKPARYVLELPAGTVDTSGIKIGEAAVFELAKEEV